MNHGSGLQGMFWALGPHARGGYPPQFGVKEFY
jgi:hypothetical protein